MNLRFELKITQEILAWFKEMKNKESYKEYAKKSKMFGSMCLIYETSKGTDQLVFAYRTLGDFFKKNVSSIVNNRETAKSWILQMIQEDGNLPMDKINMTDIDKIVPYIDIFARWCAKPEVKFV